MRVASGDEDATSLAEALWKPRVEQALQEFNRKISNAGGRVPGPPPPYVLVTTEEQHKALAERFKGKPDMALPVYASYPSTIYRDAVSAAIAWRTRQYLHEVLGDVEEELPRWFKAGLPPYVGYSIVDAFKDQDVRSADFTAEMLSQMRRDRLGETSLLAAMDLSSEGTPVDDAEFRLMSTFAVHRLAQKVPQRFDSAWLAVVSAVRAGASFERAFEPAFGVSVEKFRNEAKLAVTTLQASTPAHDGPVPPTSGPADLEDESSLPFTFNSFVEGFRRYLKAGAPKAFVYSRRGAWVYVSESPDAIERALRDCGSITPLGCKLLAVDDQLVVPQLRKDSGIRVELRVTSENDWSRQVRERWLPVVNQAVAQFESVLNEQWGVRLQDPTRVYVVTNREDYERTLRDKFGSSASAARLAAEGTDGLASADGQIITGLYAATPAEEVWESATLLVLHELAHELQNQLAGNTGRRLQRWIKEGSAEQISYLMARRMPSDPSAKFVIGDWRAQCIEWYKARGVATTKPSELLDAGFDDWMALSRSGKQPYKMAGLMLEFLQERLGKDYYPALLKYFRDGSRSREKEQLAFEAFTGMKMADFMKALDRWLETL
ncbi:hypothetical protein [Viridibacterium curvum]|uniref:DUF1570 domain-containing protein n=1 Tax=Viridibacterium curvum TaxID=1101404 RepID=A0ABP9QCH3_9RHOO